MPAPPSLARRPDAALEDAARQFASTGKAPVIERSDSVIYPFGESQPVLQCTPLRACDVELEAGEVVHGVALGDTERWISSPLYSGDPGLPGPARGGQAARPRHLHEHDRHHHAPHVSPQPGGAREGKGRRRATSAAFASTTRATSCSSGPTRRSSSRRAPTRRGEATVASLSGAVNPGAMNFDYDLSGSRFVRFRPTTVFDDGHHTYIQLPASAAASDAPAFLARTESGEEAILNYRMNGSWIIVDGLFERGELVAGVGRSRRTVKISNRSFHRVAEAR